MALLPVSRLTCGSWSLEWNIVLTLSLLTQHIVYQLCWWVVHVSEQSCFFMQCQLIGGVTEDAEVEQSLSGMGRLEKLVLGIDYCGVSAVGVGAVWGAGGSYVGKLWQGGTVGGRAMGEAGAVQVKHFECHFMCPPQEVQCVYIYSVSGT